jgi:hypothetical protein
MTTADRQRAEVIAAVCGALRYLSEVRAVAARRGAEVLQVLDDIGHDRGHASTLLAGVGSRLEDLADDADRALKVASGVNLADLVQCIGGPPVAGQPQPCGRNR